MDFNNLIGNSKIKEYLTNVALTNQNLHSYIFSGREGIGKKLFAINVAGGLPKEVQDRLFKEMVTTKGKNGTGLGLYMSYSNIKAHFEGDITYQTEDGKGTTFNILIPMNK